jgi:type I restriction enzyme R subunit
MHETEIQTRKEIIDKNLHLAGWNVDDPSQVIKELDIYLTQDVQPDKSSSPFSGHHFSDYALIHHGKPIAIIEAKKTSRDARLGQEQALQYAQKIQQIHGGNIPFVFYTNGWETFFWESDFYPPLKVYGFPTFDDLEWMNLRRSDRKPLSVELINTNIAGRDYQIEAIRTILEEIENKHQKFLLVMATGTGKTRVAVALVDVIKRAKWAKRILFLVDRIALRDQALDAFEDYMPTEPRWPEENEKAFMKDRRIYVTTYQTMLNLIENSTRQATCVSPFFFDLIIADESHRSIYNIYSNVLNYFCGLKLGLTATPTDRIDHDTFKLFNCDTHDPTFAYTYEEAIQHIPPYLNDYEVLEIQSKFQVQGIHGEELSPDEQRKLIAEGKDLEEIDFEGSDIERKVTNSGTNLLILREFMEECIKDPSGTLPGKTIIFAFSIAHARRLVDIFDKMYPEQEGKLARVLVSEDPRVHGKNGLLEQFRFRDMPRVAVSVDMLDTGIDVREIVNLVIAKPVYSYVKFWQMIGRGTRVLDNKEIKPWCPEKDKFLIIDCWSNFEYFGMHPQGREPSQQIPLPVRLFNTRLDKLEIAITQNITEAIEFSKSDLRKDISILPENNVVVKDNKSCLAAVEPEQFWSQLKQDDIQYLRSFIAPIMRVRTDADFKAMRFEMEVVEFSTACLAGDLDKAEILKAGIILQVSQLPLSVNIVAREKKLIEEVQKDEWWRNSTEEKLHKIIDHLAPLIQFRDEFRQSTIMELDIEDIISLKRYVTVGPENQRIPVETYRERIERYIQELVDKNPVLQKIKAGGRITDDEINQLAKLLEKQDPHITVDLLRTAYDNKSAQFIQFIKHILGLEEIESRNQTIARKFDEFIAQHNTFTSLQIQFIQMIRTFIIQTGKVEKTSLIDEPFTKIHPMGIRGVFNESEIEEILEFTDHLVA